MRVIPASSLETPLAAENVPRVTDYSIHRGEMVSASRSGRWKKIRPILCGCVGRVYDKRWGAQQIPATQMRGKGRGTRQTVRATLALSTWAIGPSIYCD